MGAAEPSAARSTGPLPDFVSWVGARRDALRATAFLLTGDWHLADDLVQEALVRVHGRWSRVARSGAPDAYTRRVLVRLNLDRQRRSWWRRVALGDPVPDPGPVLDRPPADGDRGLLLDVLATLPVSQRTVVVLRYWEDLSFAQVAAELSTREATVRSHASRGVAAMRAELARRGIHDLTDLAADTEEGPR